MDKDFFDLDDLVNRTLNDMDVTREILKCYLDETPEHLSMLKDAASAGDYAKVRDIAHELKGSSATIGAGRMRAVFESLQKASEAGAGSEIRTLIGQLDDISDVTFEIIGRLEFLDEK